jgi:hypothetical protein
MQFFEFKSQRKLRKIPILVYVLQFEQIPKSNSSCDNQGRDIQADSGKMKQLEVCVEDFSC